MKEPTLDQIKKVLLKAKKEKKTVEPKKKREPKITLEEFLNEKDDDEIKLYQVSKKLIKDITPDEKKRLNP